MVATDIPLQDAHFAKARAVLETGKINWLAKDKAADMVLAGKPDTTLIKTLREQFRSERIDVFFTRSENRRKKLLLADMDSTIVDSETLDELAACAGIKDRIAAITARAMNGELDFKEALRERVGLLKGLPESAVRQTIAATNLNPGAQIFVQMMKKNAAACVLVSGGFTLFTAAIAEQAGFTHNHGNLLHLENGVLTGTVGEPILDKNSKLDFLQSYCADFSLTPDDVLSIGDGANDLPMLEAAGLGIGYHPKPVLQDALDNCILHGDLSAALYAQGYTETEILG